MPPRAVCAAAESARQSAPWWARYGLGEALEMHETLHCPTPLNPENPKPFNKSLRSLGVQGFEGCAAEVLQVRLRRF